MGASNTWHHQSLAVIVHSAAKLDSSSPKSPSKFLVERKRNLQYCSPLQRSFWGNHNLIYDRSQIFVRVAVVCIYGSLIVWPLCLAGRSATHWCYDALLCTPDSNIELDNKHKIGDDLHFCCNHVLHSHCIPDASLCSRRGKRKTHRIFFRRPPSWCCCASICIWRGFHAAPTLLCFSIVAVFMALRTHPLPTITVAINLWMNVMRSCS